MKINRFQDARQFNERVKDYLLQDEAEHCLLLRISNTLIHHPERYNYQPYLATVEAGANIVAVAIRTPPHRLLLSKIEDFGALNEIAQDLHDLHSDWEKLPGVSGLTAEAKVFAQEWHALTGPGY